MSEKEAEDFIGVDYIKWFSEIDKNFTGTEKYRN